MTTYGKVGGAAAGKRGGGSRSKSSRSRKRKITMSQRAKRFTKQHPALLGTALGYGAMAAAGATMIGIDSAKGAISGKAATNRAARANLGRALNRGPSTMKAAKKRGGAYKITRL